MHGDPERTNVLPLSTGAVPTRDESRAPAGVDGGTQVIPPGIPRFGLPSSLDGEVEPSRAYHDGGSSQPCSPKMLDWSLDVGSSEGIRAKNSHQRKLRPLMKAKRNLGAR